MSIRGEPDKAVSILLGHLNRARDAVSYDASDARNTPIKFIQEQLENMKEPLQRFKMSFLKELCELENDLEVLDLNDLDMEGQGTSKLDLIQRKVGYLLYLLSKSEHKLAKDLLFFPKPKIEISKEGPSNLTENKTHMSEEMMSDFCSRYHSLERDKVKMCLLYLSIFPENALIKKRPIIYRWMGEGLIEDKEEGEQVFNRLLEPGFIKADTKSQWPTVNSFTVHPLARQILPDEDKRWAEVRSKALLLPEYENTEPNGSSLSTVINLNDRILAKPNWAHKELKVVQLGRWQSNPKHHIEVENRDTLNGLGSSKDLKYLSLRGISRIEALPKWILRLGSLEILDLRACHNLEKLPDGKWELNNLIHLDVSECYLLESIPEGIQHLHKLQVLKGFVIGKARKNSCKLTDLQKLSSLRKLSIRVVGEDYSDLDLSNLSSLQILTISWSLVSSTKVPSLKNLPQLKKLELHCWPVTELLEIAGLEKLYILGGKIMKLERNPTIKYLRLKHLEDFRMEGEELESLFPEYLFIQKIGCGGRYPNETLEKPGLMKSIGV